MEEEVPTEELTPEQKAAKEAADKAAKDKADKDKADKEAADKLKADEEKKKQEENGMGDGVKKAVETGWFDPKTMTIDESKINDPDVKAAMAELKSKLASEALQAEQIAALSDSMKSYLKESKQKLNVSDATLRKNLDFTNVKKNAEGKFEGIKEAIDALKTAEPNFFVPESNGSSPLRQGFNPADTSNNQVNLTSEQAWASRGKGE